jgi:hypothetical protein
MTITLTNQTDANSTDLAVVRTKRIGLAALATTTIAAVAGLCLPLADPAAGSTLEAIFGFTAAVSGLLTAALVVVACIYASVKGLWSRLAVNWPYVVWAFLAIGIARTIWSQVSNLG